MFPTMLTIQKRIQSLVNKFAAPISMRIAALEMEVQKRTLSITKAEEQCNAMQFKLNYNLYYHADLTWFDLSTLHGGQLSPSERVWQTREVERVLDESSQVRAELDDVQAWLKPERLMVEKLEKKYLRLREKTLALRPVDIKNGKDMLRWW